MRAKILLIALLAIAVVIAGCSQENLQTKPVIQPPISAGGQPTAQPAQPAAATGNAAVDDIGAQVTDINSINQELSDPELDNLSKELNSLDW